MLCHLCYVIYAVSFMLSVTIKSIMLSAIMLTIIMLSAIVRNEDV